MHHVYDDEMTFKLIQAASEVSGLSVDVCLEAFGKHFLVYCQKNGYDQILRVLGSNLFDFLTNLDNLHDHLGFIYPGMRAPSFRVTRTLKGGQWSTDAGVSLTAIEYNNNNNNNNNNKDSLDVVAASSSSAAKSGELESDQDQTMYLHYYSERKGLSPIVKGLVMAVAREFFSTEIVISECRLVQSQAQLEGPERVSENIEQLAVGQSSSDNGSESKNDNNNCGEFDEENQDKNKVRSDNYVVFKIDKRKSIVKSEDDQLRRYSSPGPEPRKSSASSTTSTSFNNNPSCPGGSGGQLPRRASRANIADGLERRPSNLALLLEQPDQVKLNKTSMLNIYKSLSTDPSSSLVNSEIMMMTFPFHVIFDDRFVIVQIGPSLLKATSRFWQKRAMLISSDDEGEYVAFEDIRKKEVHDLCGVEQGNECATCKSGQKRLVKFDHLFRIDRPKIELTFDAIADHTNQIFVVKTRPSVLNVDSGKRSPNRSSPMASSSLRHCPSPNRSSEQSNSASLSPGCPFNVVPVNSMILQRDQKQKSRLAKLQQEDKEREQKQQQKQQQQQQQQNQATISSRRMTVAGEAFAAKASSQRPGTPNAVAGQIIEANRPTLRLKGQMIMLQGGKLCVFLCSPRVDHLDQLTECGIDMSDLAIWDRARELMLMSHSHKEDREAVKKLDQATNDLKKMETKLRQENKRTNEVLHNIFPAKIASTLSQGQTVESERFDMVTCLFSDIIGFTRLCGNVKPIEVVVLLNNLYLQFDSLTNIHDVYKVETIGDAYVVVGGLPEPAQDHADRCVRMGLDMVRVINTMCSPADGQPIQMRIGVHSGPVMAGIVGVRVPRYSLFGNTTTVANTLETHGVAGKIHISDYTLGCLVNRHKFIVEPNPSEIAQLSFKTHFVTEYKGDPEEMELHEQMLQDQLLTCFDTMPCYELGDVVSSARRMSMVSQWAQSIDAPIDDFICKPNKNVNDNSDSSLKTGYNIPNIVDYENDSTLDQANKCKAKTDKVNLSMDSSDLPPTAMFLGSPKFSQKRAVRRPSPTPPPSPSPTNMAMVNQVISKLGNVTPELASNDSDLAYLQPRNATVGFGLGSEVDANAQSIEPSLSLSNNYLVLALIDLSPFNGSDRSSIRLKLNPLGDLSPKAVADRAAIARSNAVFFSQTVPDSSVSEEEQQHQGGQGSSWVPLDGKEPVCLKIEIQKADSSTQKKDDDDPDQKPQASTSKTSARVKSSARAFRLGRAISDASQCCKNPCSPSCSLPGNSFDTSTGGLCPACGELSTLGNIVDQLREERRQFELVVQKAHYIWMDLANKPKAAKPRFASPGPDPREIGCPAVPEEWSQDHMPVREAIVQLNATNGMKKIQRMDTFGKIRMERSQTPQSVKMSNSDIPKFERMGIHGTDFRTPSPYKSITRSPTPNSPFKSNPPVASTSLDSPFDRLRSSLNEKKQFKPQRKSIFYTLTSPLRRPKQFSVDETMAKEIMPPFPIYRSRPILKKIFSTTNNNNHN